MPEDCVEYAYYDTHKRNEEIYQDLCSIDKQSSPSSIYVSIVFMLKKNKIKKHENDP